MVDCGDDLVVDKASLFEFYEDRSRADDDMRVAAWHEAGHAVILARAGLVLGRVCIRWDGSGLTEYRDTLGDPVTMAMAFLAGPATEFFAGDVTAARLASMPLGGDLEKVRPQLQVARITSRCASTLAACAVRSSFPQIERVARRLMAVGEMTGDEVRAAAAPLSHWRSR